MVPILQPEGFHSVSKSRHDAAAQRVLPTQDPRQTPWILYSDENSKNETRRNEPNLWAKSRSVFGFASEWSILKWSRHDYRTNRCRVGGASLTGRRSSVKKPSLSNVTQFLNVGLARKAWTPN